MKVIFLDVDGVLNTIFTTRRIYSYTFVDTRKLLRLRDIVERTGAKLVLSSTWRITDLPIHQLTHDALVAEFERVRCPLWFSTTPYLPATKRWQEINAWLILHDVEDFIILDDWGEEEFRPMMDRLVKCDPRKGLTKERAELAIQMLGEKNNG